MESKEKKLVYAMAEGDGSAFTALYHSYANRVFQFVMRYVKSPDLAEDLQQEIFLKMWENRKQFKAANAFRPYLLATTRNHVLDYLRRIAKSEAAQAEIIHHMPLEAKGSDFFLLEKEYQAYIAQAIGSLSPTARKVFQGCREERKTYNEVAAELGISRDAIKKHMVRAMKSIRVAIEKDFDIYLLILLSLAVFFYLF
ncbi:RNA polymerase sigma factor [Sphingobacterium griseoflavum]|uniref:DNA-directed RNA polymerase sigma-70 factor n=1 Tax=Sphingobacterium griseoflavum TaxID=1474952 RepID=A0ABQ3HUW6_9SPHI|nr:RNA polymerase sigma-70 factor [Sphingobacterium griseoflavum]GHE29841.1 DNA-directed RNA polymerase sigma-70 factor [Sphingobacterium griseoflavum]